MNKHRKIKYHKLALLIFIALLIIGLLVFGVTKLFSLRKSAPKPIEPSMTAMQTEKVSPLADLDPSPPPKKIALTNTPLDDHKPPLLVNYENYIPNDFKVEIKEVRGYQFEAKAAIFLEEMIVAAEKDGISLWLVSGYRSTEKQTANFNATKNNWIAAGYSEEDATAKTAEFIAYPGTSEHSIGLAADLNSLEQTFENTPEYQWLVANCAKYGFILRYPKDKEATTKINFEPWHYRYVGAEHAAYIMENKICLEEYIALLPKD